jgi:tRNA modification GTPase
MYRGDTIAAAATPPGRGAIAIVRVSGPNVRGIAAHIVRAQLRPRRVTAAAIVDAEGATLDRGMAVLWAAPKSYTGEDVLELHLHGSPVVVRDVLAAVLRAGARLARPGEFTQRAFENGKLALSEAAAVADVIAAETTAASRAALANLGGALTREVLRLRAMLMHELEHLEGAIDFPDEIPDPDAARLDERLARVAQQLRELRASAELGRIAREGTSVAIVGPPNAGKSSLLNALLGQERALVSDEPGTTRDTIEETIVVDGVPVRLTDTAGIREHADRLESAGIARTMRALEQADVALVTIDGSRALGDPERAVLALVRERERVVFCNKADAGSVAAAQLDDPVVGSTRSAQTLAELRAAIARAGWGGERFDWTRPHLAHAYEIDAVEEALDALSHARAALASGDPVDLCAGDVQRAVAALGHVNGEAAAEEVRDGIFARFCVGK